MSVLQGDGEGAGVSKEEKALANVMDKLGGTTWAKKNGGKGHGRYSAWHRVAEKDGEKIRLFCMGRMVPGSDYSFVDRNPPGYRQCWNCSHGKYPHEGEVKVEFGDPWP